MSVKHKPASGEWRHITDEKEKYRAYLCSREWAMLRNAVRERCGGKCERCKVNEMECVHHLTYARKYSERLDDLAGWCNACHEFTHGKSDVDPRPIRSWVDLIRDTENGTGASRKDFIEIADLWHSEVEKAKGKNCGWSLMIKAMVLGINSSDRMGLTWLARAADGEFCSVENEANDG